LQLQSQNYKKSPLRAKSIDRLFNEVEKGNRKENRVGLDRLDDKFTAILKLLQEQKNNKE